MSNEILQHIKNELVNGSVKKGHPFRFFYLGTVHQGGIRQRTVVLRKLLPDFTLRFYTDGRSQKMEDIHQNTAVSALFYNPKNRLQLRIDAEAHMQTDEIRLNDLWNSLPQYSKKDYTSLHAPGTVVSNTDAVEYLQNEGHFCVVDLVPQRIEYLQLQKPQHQRVLFSRQNDNWEADFLVP